MILETAVVVAPSMVKSLAEKGIPKVRVVPHEAGLVVVMQIGEFEGVLGAARRQGPRVFQSLDGAANVLQGHGITKFECDTEGWVPNPAKRAVRKSDSVTEQGAPSAES